MKLLLTSAGITNKSIASELKKLVGAKIRIAFIPTAANIEPGNKDWLIKNYTQCEALGETDIVDISALEKRHWLPRLEATNVIVVGGGDTMHLMHWVVKSGFKEELPRLLKNRVYVGISAGSIIVSERLCASSHFLYSDEIHNAPPGLGYIDFYTRAHLNSPYFPKMRDSILKKVAPELGGDLYALDDNSALLYFDGKIKIISEGVWKKY